MRTSTAILIFVVFSASAVIAEPRVHTYSIVARDPATGELGVAVQSHWFSVGQVVTWAEAGVGAVATQSFAEISYGPLGLEMMKAGKSAPEALKSLVAGDDGRDVRQVAMIDANGNVEGYTGKKCIAAAGHQTGKNYSVQANLMEKSTVWPAMAKAFESAKGSLADRLLAALEAAQAEGGDIRGQQSAAIVIVSGKKSGFWWKDRLMDLRVDDHPDPLRELRRLMKVSQAYSHASRGDELMAQKDFAGGLKEYQIASQIVPDNLELVFWAAVTMYTAGEKKAALEKFRQVFRNDPDGRWAELITRLPASDLLPKEGVAEITAVAPKRNP